MINAKLEELKRGKQELVNSVNERRGTDYDISVKWDKLADEIERVGFQSGTLETLAERKISYERIIPNKALEYVMLNNVGGMSYTSENLLDIADKEGTTLYGITYSVSNGVITLSGTATQDAVIYLDLNTTLFDSYAYKLFINGTVDDSTKLQFINTDGVLVDWYTFSDQIINDLYLDSNVNKLGISISNGEIYDFTLSIMLVKGSVAPTEYKQYFSGIRDSKVTKVVNIGANVLQSVDAIAKNGVLNATFTIDSNGHFSLIQTSNLGCGFDIIHTFSTAGHTISLPKGTYTIKAYNKVHNNNFQLIGRDENGNTIFDWWASNSNDYATFTLTEDNQVKSIVVYTTPNETLEEINVEFDLMLVKGSTAPSEYVAYVEPTTLPVAELIQNLEGYGLGIDATYNNYIDYYNKKYVQKVTKQTISNTNYWLLNTNGYGNYYQLNLSDLSLPLAQPSSVYGGGICDNLTYARYGYANNKLYTISFDSTGKALIVTTDYAMTLEEFKAWLTENPITIVYALATPIETDLSAYDLPLLIKTQPLGSLTFTNEYQHDIPNTITWQEVVE